MKRISYNVRVVVTQVEDDDFDVGNEQVAIADALEWHVNGEFDVEQVHGGVLDMSASVVSITRVKEG